ncbi:MAG: hypothetical protein NT090_13205 [Acidobacteria bacterium]|nr:hypothetical protein [Acidobacteriota bacterium]
MRNTLLAVTTAAMMILSSGLVLAQTAPTIPCPNCPAGGVPKKDGTGPGAKKGKRTGPGDGSGPQHTPPNQGRRSGRR